MAYGCVHYTYAVPRSSLADLVESEDVSHTRDSSLALALQLTPIQVQFVSRGLAL